MIAQFLSKLFGSYNDRLLKTCYNTLSTINSLEIEISKLSDDDLKNKREYFLNLINTQNKTLDDILPEAFAVVREASKRVLGMRHFDSQIIGGIVLHEGKIAEMKTGEGKTLSATLPAYLNAITGKGVHIVTANDYLVKRDAEHMEKLFNFLGLSCGCVINSVPIFDRKNQYGRDVTYCTNNELGFDYLRDNMKITVDEMCVISRGFNYAIVDEIDSILIDEARTPLIISGYAEQNLNLYYQASELVSRLSQKSYIIDEKHRSVMLSEDGFESVENLLRDMGFLGQNESVFGGNQYGDTVTSPEVCARNAHIIHNINQALRAHKIFKNEVDYLVKDGQVYIIDDFTGRIAEGRRFSEGLHQALEAKHKLDIRPETQTLASITYQNYFRLYSKLSGMTGTATTEAEEFKEIYKLGVVSIPTNKPMIRIDKDDVVYRTEKEKFSAITKLVLECHKKGQPVLVGTASVSKSEKLSQFFKNHNIEHNVLNAKQHEHEADIIADAGKYGAVTIATNMAGRGTDIVLGGSIDKKLAKALRYVKDEEEITRIRNKISSEHSLEAEKVKDAGGLFVLGSERHESRRIDNQLRGRSGRQGDRGESQFFLSLEDDLLRIFGGDKLDAMLSRFGFKEGESLQHPWLNSVIRKAQVRIEAQNFEIRKNLLKYDNIMNEQRTIIYDRRLGIVKNSEEEIKSDILELASNEIENIVLELSALDEAQDLGRTTPDIIAEFNEIFGTSLPDTVSHTQDYFYHEVSTKYNTISNSIEQCEKHRKIMLYTLDICWKEHLYNVDKLRTSVSLRSYANKDPLNEYKIEAFKAFEFMMSQYSKMVLSNIFRA